MQVQAVRKHHGMLRCTYVPQSTIQRSNLRGMKSGCCASGRMERKSLQSSISRPCHRASRSRSSHVWRNCGGESNAITKNSSKRLDSTTGRVAAGEAFISSTTLCAVAHAFLVLRRAIFPPQLPRKLDTSGRSYGAPAGPRSSHREMPMLSTNPRSRDTSSRTLENVIK